MVDKEAGQIGSKIMKRGCLVGLATVGHHSFQFTRDLMSSARPLNYFYTYLWVQERNIAEAYNIIFDHAKEGNFEFVFLKEEDTIAEPHSWTTMLNKMRYNPDIFAITGVYPRKYGGDPTPMFYRGNGRGAYLDWKWGEFFEVTGIPFGCTIVRVSDLERLDESVDDMDIENWPQDGQSKTVKAYCKTISPIVDPSGKKIDLVSQDLYFSEKAQKAGLKLYVDASVNCYHLDLKTGAKYIVPHYLHDPKYHKDKGGKTAIDLGCGQDWRLVHNIEPVRVDYREEVEPDLRMDLRDMSGIATESYDYVFSSHTLEHFPDDEARRILSEMNRICKPGGEIQLILPNVLKALQLLEQGHDEPIVWWHLYGQQKGAWDHHFTGFTSARIGQWLTELKLRGFIIEDQAALVVRAFKEPLPDWYGEWILLDKTEWTRERYLDYDLEVPEERKIRVGKLELPIDDSVPDEDIEAYFTPSTRTDEERKGGE